MIESIMRVEVEVEPGRRVPLDLASELAIDPEGLDRALCEFPGKLAWFGVLYERGRLRRENYERALEELEYEVEAALRRNPPEGFKVTEKALEAEVAMNADVKLMRKHLAQALHEEKLANLAYRAFDARKDVLLALYDARRRSLRGHAGAGGVMAGDDDLKERAKAARRRRSV